MTKEEKIQQFLISNKSKLRNNDMEYLQTELLTADEAIVDKCLWTNLKNPWVTFILNFFFADLGGGHWYLGNYGAAIVAIVTFTIFAILSAITVGVLALFIVILWIVLLCWSFGDTYNRNYELITDLLE